MRRHVRRAHRLFLLLLLAASSLVIESDSGVFNERQTRIVESENRECCGVRNYLVAARPAARTGGAPLANLTFTTPLNPVRL